MRGLVLVMGLSIIVSGCDLFRTRSAESPDTGRHTWNTPRVPGDVLDNLTSAIFERDAVNYLRAFDEQTFSYEADAVALAHDPSLAPWTYNTESRHVTRFFSEGTVPRDSVLVCVYGTPQETLLGDSAVVRVHYDLTAGIALTGAPHRMAGTADYYMRVGREGYWQVYLWKDSRTEEQSTWSDLKSLVR
jgi:hypothetical protein